MKHLLSALGVLSVLTLSSSACGSSSPTGPSPFTQTINGSVAAGQRSSHDLTASRGGTMTITLTWAAGTDRDLDLILTDTTCQDLFGLNPCVILQQSIASSGTSETISQQVQQGQSYRIWIDSYSTTNHSYSLLITIQ